MWRLPVSQVHQTGKWSFVQDNGVCQSAVHDALQAITEGVAALAPGSTLTDVVGAAKDARDIGKKLTPKKQTRHNLVKDRVVIIFHYLQDTNMRPIGSGKIGFRDVYPLVRDGLSAMAA